jgi:GNAT superfamily N-acetyltransferase
VIPVESTLPRTLDGGLLLRWSTVDDRERLADLIGHVYRSGPQVSPNATDAAYIRLLMRGDHPHMTPGDVALVEEVASGRIVACACLWRQTWSYGGIPFLIGRPEMVATDPEYRQRGLIRAIFAALHRRSAARGDALQAISGIRYFYRQFGYEYALERGGAVECALDALPAVEEPVACMLRPAREGDLPQLLAAYDHMPARGLVAALPSGSWWRYKLATGETPGQRGRLLAVVDPADAVHGYVEVMPFRTGPAVIIRQAELEDEATWAAVAAPLLGALRDLAPTIPALETPEPATRLTFVLGPDHPLATILTATVATRAYPPSAWYVRVPNLPRFLVRIASVLAERLAHSPFRDFSGDLTLDCYRNGLRLTFAHGALVGIGPWQRPAWGGQEQADAAIPLLLFLQLLFGYRRLDQLRATFPDVWYRDEAGAILQALFPPALSCVLPLD